MRWRSRLIKKNDSQIDQVNPALVKVLLVDDHPLLRMGLKEVLEESGIITVCGEASNANEAMTLINKDQPDVVVSDITIDGHVNGIDLVKSIRERFPEIISIILSMHHEAFYIERSIKAGARGYVTKNEAPLKLIDAIKSAMNGELYLNGDVSKQILDSMLQRNVKPSAVSTDNLSDREFEIFQMIGTGYSIKEIAKKLNLSIYTIESHKRNIKTKLNISKSPDLIKHAIQWTINQD